MADVPECLTQTLDEIKSAHFTICQKPWNCEKQYVNPLCRKLHLRWYELRKGAEEFYGIKIESNPCPKGGNKWYKPIDFEKAVFPNYATKFVVEKTVGFMPPLPGSGFPEGVYW